jgi:carbamoyltransferase
MKILGLNLLHADSSAFLVIDGELICGIDEERINRIKHSGGFPINAINFCMEYSGLKISDLNFITTNKKVNSNILSKIKFLLNNFWKIDKSVIFNKKKLFHDDLSNFIRFNKFNGKLINIDHHLSHIASAYYCSPFDDSANVSIDGSGDFVSNTIGYSTGGKIKITNKVLFPHSIGNFYQTITNFLGFKNHGDEYKVMGMAAYGKPFYIKHLSNIIFHNNKNMFRLNLKYFTHYKHLKSFEIKNGKVLINKIYDQKLLEDLFGFKERGESENLQNFHFDLASSVQHIYEEFFFKILNKAYNSYPSENLTLSGGCAMNSLANGKIKQNTKFKNVFIQPASGDGGGSLGSAIYQSSKYKKIKKNSFFTSYFGKKFSSNDCYNAISKYVELKNYKINKLNLDKLDLRVCEIIKKSGVVGRFVGRCEWGSRALGNRSILADPSNPNIRSIINSKIKKRESFRPFAPSILDEFGNDWFENYEFIPHMMQVLRVKEHKRSIIPAVTHIDGTGRLQSVCRKYNEQYYNLIKKFNDLFGIPMLLNTSFNENEPIVFTPEQAIETFLKTKMDALILEDYLITRANE